VGLPLLGAGASPCPGAQSSLVAAPGARRTGLAGAMQAAVHGPELSAGAAQQSQPGGVSGPGAHVVAEGGF